MKTFKLNLLGLALAGLILGACSQTGTYETADLMNEQAADKAGFKLTPFGSGNENARTYSPTDCSNPAFCIDPAAPEYSYQERTISNNSGPNTRVFTYTVNNTLTGFDLAWSYAATNNAGRKLKITVSGAGFSSSQTFTSPQYNGTNAGGTHTFTFDASWAACGVVDIVAVMLDGDDIMVSGPITTMYGLIGECGGCEESFTYAADEETGVITFTYISEESIAGAELSFTFAQSANVSIDGFTANSNGNVLKATMDLEACEIYTFEANVNDLRCTGQGQSSVNVWTDFNVDDNSKKNDETPNIVWACN